MSEKPIIPKSSQHEIYQIVAQRRIAYDGMMWQAPFLSLTAQAFLLTIALSADTYRAGRIISAALSMIASFASIQLLLKHRCDEVADSKWLEAYEDKNFDCQSVHARPIDRAFVTMNWITRRRSACVWVVALAAFGIAAFIVLLITFFAPEYLGSVIQWSVDKTLSHPDLACR